MDVLTVKKENAYKTGNLVNDNLPNILTIITQPWNYRNQTLHIPILSSFSYQKQFYYQKILVIIQEY